MVEDAMGNEVAQICKESDGKDVVQIAPSVTEPLTAIAVAASVVCRCRVCAVVRTSVHEGGRFGGGAGWMVPTPPSADGSGLAVSNGVVPGVRQ
jgi:hypothetical protein